MNKTAFQYSLFQDISMNPTYEIKRQIRMALTGSDLSRAQVADKMNQIAVHEGMRKTVSKETLDSWTKRSEPDRLPSLHWMTIFCHVLDTLAPIAAMLQPLGAKVIGPEDLKILTWARAERDKKRAAKRARVAEQALEDF